MGMNLYPKDDPDGESVDYNWTGWSTLVHYLQKWGVDTSEFKGVNDGDPISADTCRKVAKALEDHMHELPPDHKRSGAVKISLAACPFCGGKATVKKTPITGGYYVDCDVWQNKCQVSPHTWNHPTVMEAVKAWNTRAGVKGSTAPALTAQRERACLPNAELRHGGEHE